MKNIIRRRYIEAGFDNNAFESYWEEYEKCPTFKINENVSEVGGISEESHFIMRQVVTEKMKEVFLAMKVDLDDSNVMENLEEGNIGTPGRIAKMWCSSKPGDMSELFSGRWASAPRMAAFPNDTNRHDPVFVTTRLDAVCSHHFIRFGDDPKDETSFVVIGYIPREK